MRSLLMALVILCAIHHQTAADSPQLLEFYRLHGNLDSSFAVISQSSTAEMLDPLIEKLDQAGTALISADVKLPPDERMAVQCFAYSFFSKESTLLLKLGRAQVAKDGIKKQLGSLWLDKDGLPQSAKITVNGKPFYVMLSSLYAYRKTFFGNAAAAAAATEDYDGILKFGQLYDKFNTYPSELADANAYTNKLKNYRAMLDVHIKMYQAEAVRNQLFNIYNFLQKHNSSLSDDKVFTVAYLNELDETFTKGEITYLQVDPTGALQELAGDTYLMMFDNAMAVELYQAAIKAGNKSGKMYVNRLLAATQLGDRDAVKAALDDLKNIPKGNLSAIDQTTVRDITLQYKSLE